MAKKKNEFIPADLVKKLYSEGRTDTEIITQLRSQGFTPSQIDRALKAVPKSAEEYKGPLPKEVVPPPARAERPAPKPFVPKPIGKTPIGLPSEKIDIPEELKPMEIRMPADKPAPAQKKPAKSEKLPAPVEARPAPTGRVKISLEELVEQVVAEHEKRVDTKFKKLAAEHESNIKIREKLEKQLDSMDKSLKDLEKTSEDKISSLNDSIRELSTKVGALQTAFKGLSKFLKK